MPLLKSRKKTTEFFSKTIKSLKSMLVFHGGDGQGISTRPSCHPFSCSRRTVTGIKQHKKIIDEFYSDKWMMDDDEDGLISTSNQDKIIVISSSNNMKKQDDEKMEMNNNDKGGIRSSSSCRVISQRMKELEMMEFKDVDHVLDVEEVLHYYSRLRSPVYLDIVDSFFTDMYAELLHKHKPQLGLHSSKRRSVGLGPIKKLQT